jgi:hypothetical protein
MKIAIVAACVFASSAAYAADVDWKFYGSAKNNEHCFLETKGVARQPDGHIRVWTKCLSADELDAAIAAEQDKAIVDRAARLVLDGYAPPISKFIKFSSDQLVSVVMYEQAADLSPLEPTTRICWELDCSEKMIRALDVWARSGVRGAGSRWDYVAPETNADRMLKILCRS